MDPRLLPFLAQQTAETQQAPAATPSAAPGPDAAGLQAYMMPAMLIAVVAIMYFFSIRPARKEEARKKEMLGALKKGDTVVTASGIIGSVHALKEDTVILRIGDNARIEMLRSAVQDVRGRSSEKVDKEESK